MQARLRPRGSPEKRETLTRQRQGIAKSENHRAAQPKVISSKHSVADAAARTSPCAICHNPTDRHGCPCCRRRLTVESGTRYSRCGGTFTTARPAGGAA
jgi:hypothetical protein